MKLNKTIKLMNYFLVFALLFSFHLCACEEALAVAESASHVDASCGHHESKNAHQENHDSNKEDDASCCTNILAVQNPSKLIDEFTPSKAPANFSSDFGSLFSVDDFSSQTVKFEFPPRASPPDVFLTSHFIHAPPLAS